MNQINKNNEINDLKSNLSQKEVDIFNLTKSIKDNINEKKYQKYINQKLNKEIILLKKRINEIGIENNKNLKNNKQMTLYFSKIIQVYNNQINNLYSNLPNIIFNLIDMNLNPNMFNKFKGNYILNQIKIKEWNNLFKIIPDNDNQLRLKLIFNNLNKKFDNKYYNHFINNYKKLIEKIKNFELDKINFSIPNFKEDEFENYDYDINDNMINYINSDKKIWKKHTIDLDIINRNNNKLRVKKKRTNTDLINFNKKKIQNDINTNDDLSFFDEINNLKLFNDINENYSYKSIEFNNKIKFENISNLIFKILKNYKEKEKLDCNFKNLSKFLSIEINEYIKYFIDKIKKLSKELNKLIYEIIQYIVIIPKKFINIIHNFFKINKIEEKNIFIIILNKITLNINNLNLYYNKRNYELLLKELSYNRKNIESEFINKINKIIDEL